MKNKKSTVHAYLDELESKKLIFLADKWGCSLSGAIRRLIREKE